MVYLFGNLNPNKSIHGLLDLQSQSIIISIIKLTTAKKTVNKDFAHNILAKSQFKVGKMKIRSTLLNPVYFSNHQSKTLECLELLFF